MAPPRAPGPHTTSALARDLPLLPTTATAATAAATAADGGTGEATIRDGSADTIPRLMYGTAWKKERTADLVYEAIKAGFRGIDTAAQPRHYREDLVGEGIRRAVAEGIVARKDLFIQTKYTPISGQDPDNLPYDPSLPIASQVHASMASSLKNLSTPDCPTPYIDSLVLHSPLATITDTLAAWTAMATFVSTGQVRRLGISNTPQSTVSLLLSHSLSSPSQSSFTPRLPPPSIVQNRFYPRTHYEVPLRALCRSKGIIFQGFWVLSGDGGALRREAVCVRRVAESVSVERATAQYALVLGLGREMCVLDGTTDGAHIAGDVEGVEKVGRWAESECGRGVWGECLAEFRGIVGEEDGKN